VFTNNCDGGSVLQVRIGVRTAVVLRRRGRSMNLEDFRST